VNCVNNHSSSQVLKITEESQYAKIDKVSQSKSSGVALRKWLGRYWKTAALGQAGKAVAEVK